MKENLQKLTLAQRRLVFFMIIVGGLLLITAVTLLLLVFNNFELIVLIGTAVIAAFIALDGESNWFEGAMLLGVYLIIALAFLFLPAEAAHTVAHP